MKASVGGWFLFAFALPAVVAGYLWLLLLCVVFVAEWGSLRFQGAGVLTAKTRPWAAKFWGFSTTVGRAILYHPLAYDETAGVDNRSERHEFVHIKQWEDACTWGLIGGLLTSGIATWLGGLDVGEFLAVWLSIYALSVATKLTNYLTAVLRYGPKGIYRDAEHERSAYAQTDFIRAGSEGKDWDTLRDEHRERQQTLIE